MGTPHWDKPDRGKPDMETPDGGSLPDHYAALQVQASASQQEIARAYRALMRNLHPDVDGGRPAGSAEGGQDAAKSELLRIMQAFAVLRDPGRRAAYDQSRARSREVSHQRTGPQGIPVRHVRRQENQPRPTIRITPVRWESGPWA